MDADRRMAAGAQPRLMHTTPKQRHLADWIRILFQLSVLAATNVYPGKLERVSAHPTFAAHS
jgi:hypothetical protein